MHKETAFPKHLIPQCSGPALRLRYFVLSETSRFIVNLSPKGGQHRLISYPRFSQSWDKRSGTTGPVDPSTEMMRAKLVAMFHSARRNCRNMEKCCFALWCWMMAVVVVSACRFAWAVILNSCLAFTFQESQPRRKFRELLLSRTTYMSSEIPTKA
jgi:hypothetical protein